MKEKSIIQSIQEYGRGIIGGLLFSLPMLYTKEVWFTSFNTTPLEIMLYMVVVYILLLGYNKYAGLRENASWQEIAIDSVEEMGLGIILSFLFLLLLGSIRFADMSLERIINLVLIEAMPIAIGVSVGTAQLGASSDTDADPEFGVNMGMKKEEEKNEVKEQARGYRTGESTTLEHILLSACAGMLFAANIAPTDEVAEISYGVTPLQLMAMLLTSLFLNGIVLFYIDFRGSYETPANERPSIFQVIWDTSLTYATAVCISAGALWFFGRFDDASFYVCVEMTVVLGIVSSLGASAGRFLLDQEFN